MTSSSRAAGDVWAWWFMVGETFLGWAGRGHETPYPLPEGLEAIDELAAE